MAQVKYGAIITEIKGKQGGTVFKGTRSGFAMQNKQTRSNTNTSYGKIIGVSNKSFFNPQLAIGELANGWRALSDANRAAFAAAAPSFPAFNRFGEPYVPSGYQVYITVNMIKAMTATSLFSTPPTPAVPAPASGYSVVFALGIMELTGTIPAGEEISVFATRPLPSGRNPKQSDFKQIDFIGTSPSADNMSIPYSLIFGFAPTSGNVWFLIKPYMGSSGQSGTPQIIKT